MFSIPHLDLPPLTGAEGTVRLPGSKSISNRVLLLAGLSAGTTAVHDLLDSDDTAVMLAALGVFGTRSAWPDLAVAAVMASLAIWGGWSVMRQARRELRAGRLSQKPA